MKKPLLLEIHDTSPGYTRKKDKDSWKYFDRHKLITDRSTISRIEKLSIIPSWSKVWICKHSRGYLQATGYDQAGRKQYLYHKDWHKYRSEKKLSHILVFKDNLNEIRKKISMDLEDLETYSRESISALALWMIDKGGLRLGNWKYFEENQTTGTITLQKKHVFNTYLKFIGKSNQQRKIPIDKEWNSYLEYCLDSPKQTLLSFYEENQWKSLTANDIRVYLQKISPSINPKDFRTWWAEVEFIHNYYNSRKIIPSPERMKVIQHVASGLGHTPSVCKKFYITEKVYSNISKIDINKLENMYKKSRKTTYCSRKEQFAEKVLRELL